MMWVEQSRARVGVPYPHFKQDGERRDLCPYPVPHCSRPRPPRPIVSKSPL
ncbi:unnamed protein product [Musa hybrid cultivar]